jgi:hypothetical protein
MGGRWGEGVILGLFRPIGSVLWLVRGWKVWEKRRQVDQVGVRVQWGKGQGGEVGGGGSQEAGFLLYF